MVYKYSAHCFSLEFESECHQRRKKSLSVFVLDSKKKTTKSFCRQTWVWRVGFEISRERRELLLQSKKWLKVDKAPEKPFETTVEWSFTSSLASGASFFGREAAKRETKSREIPRHIKIGWSTVLKVYCRRKMLQEKSVELLKNVSSKSGLGSTWLVRCENENCPLQITNEAFSTTERIEQSRAFEINCSSVVGFRFQLFLLCHYCCPFSGMHQHWQLWCYNLL